MSHIESLLLGFSLAAIPGPIFFEVIRRTLTKGFWSGALLSFGEFIANIMILLLTFFGIHKFLLYKEVKIALFLIGSGILIYIGILALKIKEKEINKSSKKKVSNKSSILVGLGLALASPLAIAVWISIGGAYLAKYDSKTASLINIILLAIGVMTFFFLMATIVHITRKKLNSKYIILFAKIFGIVLIGYAVFFLIELIKLFY